MVGQDGQLLGDCLACDAGVLDMRQRIAVVSGHARPGVAGGQQSERPQWRTWLVRGERERAMSHRACRVRGALIYH